MQQIRKFVTDGIDIGGCSQTLCYILINLDIAGIPGIGKTLTVTSVIEDLKEND
jgi:Cdc6-like AAA superfamily ATPase